MSELELTNDDGTPPDMTELAEVKSKANYLLELKGMAAITGDARFFLLEVAYNMVTATDEEIEIVRDVFAQREREANLRGDKWDWRQS